MKFRTDYVTNSSSSSFVIAKRCLTDNQLFAIRNHSEVCRRLFMPWSEEAWQIDENDDYISCYTSIDNLDLEHLLSLMDIPSENILSSDSWHSMIEQSDELEEQMKQKPEIPAWEQAVNDIKNGIPFEKDSYDAMEMASFIPYDE